MNRGPVIRKILVYAVYVLLIASFQVTFPRVISFGGQVADLMLVFTVLAGYLFGFKDGAVIGIAMGILRDYYSSPSITGIDGKPVVTCAIGLLVLFLAGTVGASFFTVKMKRNVLFAFAAVAFITLCYKIAGHLAIFLWHRIALGTTYNLTFGAIILHSILPQLLLNMIASVPIILLLKFAGPYRKGVNTALIDEEKGGEQLWLTI
ncbi:MAG: hypothetical protein J5883_04415 [Clostridiales bacterium]|nr:hypothetical protein [Clostridiales bacterium]